MEDLLAEQGWTVSPHDELRSGLTTGARPCRSLLRVIIVPCSGGLRESGLRGPRRFGGAERVVKRADDRAHLVAGDAVEDRLAVAPRRDEPLKTQPSELLRDGRLAQLQEFLKLPDRFLARQQIAQDHQPRLVRERLQEFAGLLGAFRHLGEIQREAFRGFRKRHERPYVSW